MNRFTTVAFLTVLGLVGCVIQVSYEDDSGFNKTPVQKMNIKEIQNLPPLKQMKMGIKPEDVKCKDAYKLVLGMTDESPAACLKSETSTGRALQGMATRLTETVLQTNTLEGTAPLTVGFLLNGTSGQFYSKTWFFGDGQQEGPTFSNIENHIYRYNFDDTTETSHTFHGYVNITDYENGLLGKNTESKSFNVTVLKNANEYISNFNQQQGIILQNEFTAFSISTNTKSWIGWNFEKFGSSGTQTHPFSQSEHHQYSKAGTISGNVSVTPITGHVDNVTEYWSFSVLVVPKTTTSAAILEREGTYAPEHGKDTWHAKKLIKFYVNLDTSSYGRPLFGADTHKQKFEWDFGDNTKITTHGDAWPSHSYKEPGDYLVKCNATFENNLKFQLSKTVIIVPP